MLILISDAFDAGLSEKLVDFGEVTDDKFLFSIPPLDIAYPPTGCSTYAGVCPLFLNTNQIP